MHPQLKSSRAAARSVRLDWRALLISVGAEDATVARLWPQQRLAVLALVKPLARFGRHGFFLDMPALRASECRLQCDLAHDSSVPDRTTRGVPGAGARREEMTCALGPGPPRSASGCWPSVIMKWSVTTPSNAIQISVIWVAPATLSGRASRSAIQRSACARHSCSTGPGSSPSISQMSPGSGITPSRYPRSGMASGIRSIGDAAVAQVLHLGQHHRQVQPQHLRIHHRCCPCQFSTSISITRNRRKPRKKAATDQCVSSTSCASTSSSSVTR